MKKTGKNIAGGIAFSLMLLTTNALAQHGSVLESARQALTGGDAKQAVSLLQPLESERAGDPAFDYLFGLALLDAGDPQRAIFALERVLAVQPNNAQARAEIARAYLMTGERKQALQEFDTVRNMKIPDDARQTIDRYLSAFGAGPTRLGGYLEATAGYDTNVNSATSATKVTIFNMFDAVLSPTARKHGAGYVGLSGGINFNKPLNESVALVADASFNRNTITDSSPFDTQTLNGNIGLRWAEGKNAVSVGLMAQAFSVDDNRNRNTLGLVGQWQHYFDASRQFTLFGQYLKFSYPGQHLRDANRSVVGVAYGQQFGGDLAPSFFVSGYFGTERETSDGFPQFGHKPWGMRFGGQLNLNPNIQIFASAALEHRRYGGADPLFLTTRRDKQYDLRLGLKYEPYRYWSIVPSVAYTDNRSNIALYDYSRAIYSVTLRRDF